MTKVGEETTASQVILVNVYTKLLTYLPIQTLVLRTAAFEALADSAETDSGNASASAAFEASLVK